MADTSATEAEPPSPSVVLQLRALWDRLSPRRRVVIVASLIGTVVLAAALSLSGSVENYAPLYTGMTAEDAGEVVATLKAKKVHYKVSAGGTTIEVPQEQLHELRIEMAASGFPRGGGVGFEIFDKQSFGTTSFVEQVNYRRALQGELSRSIASISAVKSARVHLAMGKRSVFKDSDEPPTASVALRLKPGRNLSDAEVRGVVHLVASSVDALDPSNVVVIDEQGRVLSSGDSENADGRVSDVQATLEGKLEGEVRRMVETVVGVGNAAVVVTADMDFSRVDQTEELYDKDKIAVRSEVKNLTRDSSSGTVGGVAGARANLDGTGSTSDDPNANASNVSETTNYEVPRILKHTVGPSATVKRLHVAVLVNHKSVPVAPELAAPTEATEDEKAGATEEKDGDAKEAVVAAPKVEMQPLSPEEMAVITAIAKSAAGINDERGDSLVVQNVPFEAQTELDDEALPAVVAPLFSKKMFYAAAAVVGLFLIVVALLLMRRKNPGAGARAQVFSLPAPISEMERVLENRSRRPDQLPGAQSDPSLLEQGSQDGDLYGRVLTTVRADASHAARVISALLDDTAKEAS